jgi:hypothetical protein
MYRALRMVEVTEVLRLWWDGVPKKRIAGGKPSRSTPLLSTYDGHDCGGYPTAAILLTKARTRISDSCGS